jgi:hypothetical protein
MAQTYAWVAEQECVRQEKERRRVDRWVFEEPFLMTGEFVPKRVRKMSGPEFYGLEQTVVEEIVYCYEEEAVRWMKHEEEVRQLAIRREKEKERAIQEQVKRIEARVRQRKTEERQKLAEERSRAYAELREREKREQAKADETIAGAWRAYEARWAALGTSSDVLSFRTIPWPVVSPPCSLANLRPADIVMFLFSPVHSTRQTRKDRVRSALLRWHPDRFRRLLGRVVEEERLAVEEGVGIVARCLNDLMSSQ